MKQNLLTTLLLFSTVAGFAQSAAISSIAQKLNDYYQFYPPEKIQLITDKDVYKPEEIIWFSMLITNSVGQQIKPMSNQVWVNLYSDNGIQITNDVFQATSGFIKGDLMLPEGLKQGRYVLVARTQLMSNANEAFLKLLNVNPKDEDAIRLKELSSPPYLTTDKSEQFHFKVETMPGDPLKNEKLTYKLYDEDNVILGDKLKTADGGNGSINLKVPKKDYDRPLKLIITNNKEELNYSKIFPVKTEKVQIKFYPEGGHLRETIPQKIGFAASDQLGAPLTISGEIVDQDSEIVAQVQTIIPGFGMASLKLQKGKKYTLRITSGLGENQQFTLPPVDDGFSFGIVNSDQDFFFSNLIPSLNDTQTIYLIANKGADIFWASEVLISGPSRIKIPKADFPNGISMLSVFDKNSHELASRLVYVDKHHGINLELSAPDRVAVNQVFKFAVTTKNIAKEHPLRLNLKISAAEENDNWPDQWDSWHQVNSDLENEISEPEELLKMPNFESTMNYLLIANQLKNFSWPQVLDFDLEQEQNKLKGSGVYGKVLNVTGQLVSNAKVSLVNSQNMQILSTSSDENGVFHIASVDRSNLTNFAVKAIDPKGNENLKVEFYKTIGNQIGDQVISFLKKQGQLPQIEYSSDFYNDNKQLFTKIKAQRTLETREPAYKKYLESGSSILDVIKIIKPYRLDGDKIIFPGGTNSFLAQGGALIVVDGQKMGTSATVLENYSPHEIESINVSTNPIDIQRYTGLNSVGLIEIETKGGEQIEQPTATDLVSIHKDGFRIPRDFWVIKKADGEKEQPTTLFWNPSATINTNGRWEYEVKTNHVLGKFQIQINAIDELGRISKEVKTFEAVPK